MIRQDKGLHLLTFRNERDCRDFKLRFKEPQNMNDGAGGTFIGKFEEKEEGKQITLYPIPFEFEEQQIISLCEEQLQVERPQKITYGHHRNHPQLRNGFLHLRLKENEIACLPEVIFINNRPVTVLKPGQCLYRPCKFCRGRTHEYDICPHYQR